MAEFLEKQTRRYCAKLKIPLSFSRLPQNYEETPLEDPNSVSFEEKWELTEKIRKLQQNTVEHIVQLVKEQASTAYEVEDDKVKIKVDLISRETFTQIQCIMNDEGEATGVPYKKHKKS